MRAIVIVLAGLMMMATVCRADWKAEADARIEKIRKGDFVVEVTLPGGKIAAGLPVKVEQTRSSFHFGVAVSDGWMAKPDTDADAKRYRETIAANFNTVVCENAMKWYATEKEQGVLTYEKADAIVKFAEENGLALRGHCLFWDKLKYVEAQPWLLKLDTEGLQKAVDGRLSSIVARYKGKVFCWDVNNEMLDGQWYEEKLGKDISAHFFKRANELDPQAQLFVNEYSILGNAGKTKKYVELIERLKKAGGPVSGVGIQEHAAERYAVKTVDKDIAERAGTAELSGGSSWKSLDTLGQFEVPIHLTEISFKTADEKRKAGALETFFTMGFSHPRVECILLWGFWERAHWMGKDAALVTKSWEALPAWTKYQELTQKTWRTNAVVNADEKGAARFRGFFGKYRVSVELPENKGTAVGYVELTKDGATAPVALTVK